MVPGVPCQCVSEYWVHYVRCNIVPGVPCPCVSEYWVHYVSYNIVPGVPCQCVSEYWVHNVYAKIACIVFYCFSCLLLVYYLLSENKQEDVKLNKCSDSVI